MNRFQATFLALVLAQGAHSVEEYTGRLWDVFAPAHFFTGLLSSNHEAGFVVGNTAFIVFGLWCVLVPVLRGWPSAVAFAWVWVAVELVNGVGHPAVSLIEGRYLPGTATALVLLPLALLLALQLLRGGSTAAA